MDSFRLRALWVVDTDTGAICAERRFPTLERLHKYAASAGGGNGNAMSSPSSSHLVGGGASARRQTSSMALIPSVDIIAAVLDTVAAKSRALESCGSAKNGAAVTSHYLLGPYAPAPQFVDCVHVPTGGARGLAGGRAAGRGMGSARVGHLKSEDNANIRDENMKNNDSNNTANDDATIPIGPFIAFSSKRGARIEASESRLHQIGEGAIDENGQDDGGATQRILIDDLLTTFESHPHYAPAENIIVIAAPLVMATSPLALLSPVPSSSAPSAATAAATGSLPFRHLLTTALLSLQSLLGPFINDTLVIGVEGAVMSSEVEGAMAIVTDCISGWDSLCGRRVVSDLTWRRALESMLTMGISMGRLTSLVAADGMPARHGLPAYGSSPSYALSRRNIAAAAANQPLTSAAALLASGRRQQQQSANANTTKPVTAAAAASPSGLSLAAITSTAMGGYKESTANTIRKSLQAQALINALDASNEDDEADGGMSLVMRPRRANANSSNSNNSNSTLVTSKGGLYGTDDVDDDEDAIISLLEIGPNPTARDIDTALVTAAQFQTTLFMEQHVAAQCFGNSDNATVAVTSHLMMVPPLYHSTRFSNRVATNASLIGASSPNNNDNVLCLLGGAPPPQAAFWATALNRTGVQLSASPTFLAQQQQQQNNTAMAGSGSSSSSSLSVQPCDAYIRKDPFLIKSIVGAPEPLPMTIPMRPALLLGNKRLGDEGLTTSAIAHATGLGRFIASGVWRLPALHTSLPTTSATHHIHSRFVNTLGLGEAYPPITAIALATDFADVAKSRRDVALTSAASAGPAGAASLTAGANAALLTAGHHQQASTTMARFGGGGVGGGVGGISAQQQQAICQRPTSILSMVHEVPKVLNSNQHNTAPAPGGSSASGAPSSANSGSSNRQQHSPPSPSSSPASSATAMRANAFVGNYAFLPLIDVDRARKAIHTMDFGQGVAMDAPTPSVVHQRSKEEVSMMREYLEDMLESQGHVLYRLDLEITLDLGGVHTADIPKFDIVFGVTDHASVLYYHLNLTREDCEITAAGGTSPTGVRQTYSNVSTQPLNDAEFVVSFTNGVGARVRNGTTYTVKGIVVCDVSDRPTAAALPSFNASSKAPSVAPNEADILSAVTIYSYASLHFTMLVERPFIPGSCVLADPVVMGKCLVDGVMGEKGGAQSNNGVAASALATTSAPAFAGGAASSATATSSVSLAMAETLEQLQKKIRAVAFSSKGAGSLVERQLSSPIRLGLPLTPFPADGDSPVIWRKSDLTSPSPITSAVIMRSHPEKGFMLWNYSGDV